MDISTLQLNSVLSEQITSKIQQEKTKDFDAVFQKAKESQDHQALKEACVQLESYMLSQLFKQMKSTVASEDSLIPKGDYEKMFEDYKINNQSEDLAKAGGIGLADMMYKQMTAVYGKQVQTQEPGSSQMDKTT